VLGGDIYDHTEVDSGVWAASKETFNLVGGLDESLTAWGHAQTEFQYRLHLAGVEFVRVPEVLFWHPRHGGERDLALAHAQLRDRGFEPRDLWKRYHGASPYA
jgi:GT2 family glycosyltransferase